MTERSDPAQPHSLPEDGMESPSVPYVHFLDPRESRPVNPNTPEGEIRNMAAFAAAVHTAPPLRRAVIKIVVWLILLGIALGIIAGVVNGFRTF